MSYVTCPVCHAFYWDATYLGAHRCPPTWHVWCPDYGESEEDALSIYAWDAESAAEAWAEKSDSDSAEYSIVRGQKALVNVRQMSADFVQVFTVYGEYDPTYSAYEVKEGQGT